MARRKLDKFRKQLDKQSLKGVVGKGVQSPSSIEVAYFRGLRQLTTKTTRLVIEELYPEIKKEEKYFIKDADSMEVLEQTLRSMRSKADDMAELHFKFAEEMADKTNKFNRRAFVRQINEAAGVDIGAVLRDEATNTALKGAINDNVNLIKTIPSEHLDRVEKALRQGIDGGKDFFSIRKDLHDIGGITQRRAQLIARDQVSKLNSNLDRIRQQSIGVESYTWDTANDERVRETHEANSGHEFRWDTPPAATGHPGEDINCRCTARPNLENILKSPSQ